MESIEKNYEVFRLSQDLLLSKTEEQIKALLLKVLECCDFKLDNDDDCYSPIQIMYGEKLLEYVVNHSENEVTIENVCEKVGEIQPNIIHQITNKVIIHYFKTETQRKLGFKR